MGGDDAAGVLKGAEFEGDRGAHDRLLPFERHIETAHPVAPMVAGALEKFPALVVDRIAQRIVLAEDEIERGLSGKALSAMI